MNLKNNFPKLSRFSKQIILPQVGIDGQNKLKNAKVLIIGMGGLGCPAAQNLAAAGIGKLGLVDHDVIEESNLHRQLLYCDSDIGIFKTHVAKIQLKKIYPEIQIETFEQKFEQSELSFFENIIDQYDFILDCSDNFLTKYLVNDICQKFNKILISASASGFDGFIFTKKNNESCFRCLFPANNDHQSGDCHSLGAISAMVGVVGTWQAMELIKIIITSPTEQDAKINNVIYFDFLQSDIKKFKVKNNKQCLCRNIQIKKPEKTFLNKIISSDELFFDINKNEVVEEFSILNIGELSHFNIHYSHYFKENIEAHRIKWINLDEILSIENTNNHIISFDEKYLIFCPNGYQSLLATEHLRSIGFENVWAMKYQSRN